MDVIGAYMLNSERGKTILHLFDDKKQDRVVINLVHKKFCKAMSEEEWKHVHDQMEILGIDSTNAMFRLELDYHTPLASSSFSMDLFNKADITHKLQTVDFHMGDSSFTEQAKDLLATYLDPAVNPLVQCSLYDGGPITAVLMTSARGNGPENKIWVKPAGGQAGVTREQLKTAGKACIFQ